MVAGMLMPLSDLRAIYEVLFRDGVMVAKKDKRPQIKHPEIENVTNLQVIRAMGSLKSRGFVRETFAWRHFYWYLTNDGIVYLRDYLRLPAEIVPASLQRIRKPAATLPFAHRAAHVQTVEGPTSYVAKQGRRDEAESREALAERQGYRHKMLGPGERENYSDRAPKFRGRPLTAEPVRQKESWEMESSRQPLFRREPSWRSAATAMEEHKIDEHSVSGPSTEKKKVVEVEKQKILSSVPIQPAALKQQTSQMSLSSSITPLPITVSKAATASKALDMPASPKPNEKKSRSTEKLKTVTVDPFQYVDAKTTGTSAKPLSGTAIAKPAITKPEIKQEKTKAALEDPGKSADAKKKSDSAAKKSRSQTVVTSQETSQHLCDTAIPAITKPVDKDVMEKLVLTPEVIKANTAFSKEMPNVSSQSTTVIPKTIEDDVNNDKTTKGVSAPSKATENYVADADPDMRSEPVLKKTSAQNSSTVPPVMTKPIKQDVKEKTKEIIVDPPAAPISATPVIKQHLDINVAKGVTKERNVYVTKPAEVVDEADVASNKMINRGPLAPLGGIKLEGVEKEKTGKRNVDLRMPKAEITVESKQGSTITKDTKEMKTKREALNQCEAAQTQANTEETTDGWKPIAEITIVPVKKATKVLKDQVTAANAGTKAVEKELDKKVDKGLTVMPNMSAEIQAVADTANQKPSQEDSKILSGITTTTTTTTPGIKKTAKKEKSQKTQVKEELDVPNVKATQSPCGTDMNDNGEKMTKLSVAQVTLKADSTLPKPVESVKAAERPSDVSAVTLDKSKLDEAPPKSISATEFKVKTNVPSATIAGVSFEATKSEVVLQQKKLNENVPPHLMMDESKSKEDATKVLAKQPTSEQVESTPSVTTQNVITIGEAKESKQVVESSSKSKRKKKKTPGEMSKNTSAEECADVNIEPKVTLTDSLPKEVTGNIKMQPAVTQETSAASVSVKTGEKTNAKAEKTLALMSVVPTADALDKEKLTKSNITQGTICPKNELNASLLQSEPVKCEEKTVIRVETMTMQEISQVKEKGEDVKPTLSEKPLTEIKSPSDTEAEEPLKGKKKGKKTAKAALSQTVKPALLPEAELIPAANITSLPKGQATDSFVAPSEASQTSVSLKTTPEKTCSEEVRPAAVVLSEAQTNKGEVEPAAKRKREVPKPETSSTARKAPAAGETVSAATAEAAVAQAQAGPLDKPKETPRVAQHLASQAAECSTEERLSVSEAVRQGEQKKKESEEDTPSFDIPSAQLDLPHLQDTCNSERDDQDEAAMKRKIVVVEEIVEVKQVLSPEAAGAQSPPLPVQPEGEEEEEELDLDVLEAIAVERALSTGAPVSMVYAAPPEVNWDHSLEEPEEKIWPNFIEDERDRVQKKTFTKWVNKHLIKRWRGESQRHVSDLYEDLRDGHNLISLLEVLSGESLPREKGRMRFHKLQNVQIALDFLRHRQVKLVNIRNDDIADGNPKLTLGLIWTIILHFQVSSSISDIQVNGQSEDMTAKEKLLLWSQRTTDNYQGIRCDNFTTSWRDGKLFNAVIHKHYPRLIDMGKVHRQSNLQNLEQAFGVAERDLGVTRLLDPEDVDVPHPDEKSIITYVSSLYDAMPRTDVLDGMRSNELELRWQEYYELVTLLQQWIRHHVMIFEERKFPASYEEIELLWRQFLKFKETELPVKESDKNHSKQIYQTFESAVHAGQIKVPPGYHPIDVEKEWGRLHVAILERERLLRIEFERLERLQRIYSKVQMESGVSEDQLNHLETLLQTDIRLMIAGKPPKHTAEVERELDKADKVIRLLFNDVQVLKDGRHPQAEQMYRRVYHLHERLVNLRSDYNLRLKSTVTTEQVSLKSSQQSTMKVRPELDDVTLRYVQDLLAWVEENQHRIDEAEWGTDLPTVESQLGSHRGLHQTVEDFKSKIERAKADESQLSPLSKDKYKEYLGKLDLQYGKLQNSSKSRLRNLESLHAFVSAATKELMWLNDKEEEEVLFDWSDRNTNMTAKKDNYSALMRELELREKKINDIQALGDKLVRDGHAGKKTVEAFTAALQTQWSWILQLCCCIEAHLKENTAYYQFFADVKEAQDKMKKMQENIKKKYSCDRTTTTTRLEDLLQDAVEEKEQLNEFKNQLTNLNKRAKSVIQLKPRNPSHPIKGKQPIQAVCDFKQQEITVHKGNECALLNNSQPSQWKVLSRSGNEAVVPSVCFMVPPVNKEAVDSVTNLDAQHQQMVSMWQTLHIDMKTLLSWQYLMRDFTLIRSWNISMLKNMKPEEYRQTMRNFELHYQDYLRDCQDSQLFGPNDRKQVEEDYTKLTLHFDNLLRSMEKGLMAVRPKGQKDETLCKNYLSEVKDLRLRIEDCDTRTVARIRKPVDKEPLKECMQKATEQTKVHVELDGLKKELNKVSTKTKDILASPEQSGSAPVLRSELELTVQKMDHTYMLSSVYLDKLKTVEMVIRNSQGAEGVLKQYEDCLHEVHTVPSDIKEVEAYKVKLKKMRAEAEGEQPVFDSLEEEMRKASAVSEKMSRVHSERDVELEHYRQQLSNLQDRWKAVFSQIDLRQRELEQLGRQLGYYRGSYDWLIRWIADAKQRQEKIQAVAITDSKTLKEQLAQEKQLLEEIEQNKEKVDECQEYAKAYIDTIKDYELQLIAYKAQVEPHASSPLKKTKLDSASDNIIQEYVTLRTRYSELMTLTSQYIKFITDTQRRIEDEEIADAQQKQMEHEKTMLQQTFLTEKEMLLKKEKMIEDEKKKLESQFEEEVKRAKALKDEQERQKQQMEEEKKKLQATMDAALSKQKEAESEMLNKQKEMEELERLRLEQERILADENQKLREKLQQLEGAQKDQQSSKEVIKVTTIETTQKVYNGQNAGMAVDGGDKKPDPMAFDGIRDKVPASRLQSLGLLPKKEFDQLKDGKTTVQKLGETENLKQILKGKNPIAGILTTSKVKMPIYQALKEKKITPGTALILLEAQAATGYIIDPIKNQKLSVNEAVKEGLIGPELHNKMLLADRAVVGYKDPYTGGKISVFEAMKKGLIEHDHAIRLLEAQLATGGIIDPINSHRVSNEIAFKQGQYDTEINKVMENPSDDTKGYFDPSTQEPLLYSELMERCSTDPETGLLLLPITDKAAQCSSIYTEEETKDVFSKTTVSVPFGKFQGKAVTIWEIINSEYFSEDQKKDLLRQYKTGKITIEKIIKIIITVAGEKEKKNEITFDGLRAPVPATELLESKIIDKDLYNKLHKGNVTVKEVAAMDPVSKSLKGSNSIAGVVIESSRDVMSFYEAMKKDIMRPGPALNMLEAQAGTGYVIDPVKNQKFTVDEAVKAGVVGPELHEKLLSAERAVTGYKDPYTGKTVSLFQAMKKDLIPKEQGIRLLDAQMATGGIIDPVKSHRVPNDVACKRDYFDDEMKQSLNNPTDETKCFFDPNTKENVTYSQLFKRCTSDKKTGLQLLPLSEDAINAKETPAYTEAQSKEAMTQASVELDYGPFKGKKMTLWEILNSDHLTEEQRRDLLDQFRSGRFTIEKIMKIIITIVDEKEAKNSEQSGFKGLRAPVPAKALHDSKIIDKNTFDLLQQKKITPEEVSRNADVYKYLQGSESIAGIYVVPTKEKTSIYQAMKKKLIRDSTGLSLLEAQAATGFMVDPVKNQCLSVDEAVRSGLVGPELHEKLLSAEKAVTGYKDPFTGKKISLFEAVQKELIPKEQAMPMLQAQMVSGGIIDPVNSHRVPTDVAHQKKIFSKDVAKTISEPSDDNKIFCDPETDESVTYKQLKDKCQRDKDTGLYMLPLSKPQSPTVVEKTYLYTEQQTQSELANTQIDIPIEGLAEKPLNLWDVVNSNMLPEQERQKLIDEYRSGKITKERMIIIIIEIMEQREVFRDDSPLSLKTVRRRITIEELHNARIIDLETYNLLKRGQRDIRDIMELSSVKQYLYGTGCVAGVTTDSAAKVSIYQAMTRGFIKPEIALSLLEAQAATGFLIDPVKNERLTVDEAVRKDVVGPEIHDKLLSAERAVTGYKDPYSGKTISLFQAMKKDLVQEDYAMKMLEAQTATGGIIDPEFQFHLPADVALQRGYINKETNSKLTDVKGFVDPVTDEQVSYAELLKRCKLDSGLRLLSLGDKRLTFKGLRKQITMEELIRSQVIDQKTVTELNEGLISVEEVSNRLSRYLEGTSSIAGVYLATSKERLSIYQAMKKNMIRPGTAFELLEAQASTGYVIDPIKNLKLTVQEAVKMGIVGPEFKDKLLSAERAVTGYRDPYSGKTISLFQAMKKGLILKDHGIRLLEAQIATGGIIDPEESHRVPVEVAYKRGFFDEEMNEILTDPSDDTKGFFDPNTEENLTYLQLMERCITDPDTGLVLLQLKEKKRERKASSKSSVRKRRVVIVDPETGREMTVYEAYKKGLIDHQTYLELAEQECEWEEITMTSSDGVEQSIIIDRRSGRQYDVDDALARGFIDQNALDRYRNGILPITEFADMLSGGMGGFRSRSSSFGSTTGSPMSPLPSIKAPAVVWDDPSEETGPIAGILDIDTLEKVSITEAMHRSLVDNITGQRLLEAQACTGGIFDPLSGERFPVSEATEKGLVDKGMVERLNLAQKSFNGFEDPRSKEKMSASQALKKGWLYYEAGQRFLEIQYLTGGLIEPGVEGRVSLDESLKKGTIDARTAQKLRDVNSYSKYITCPKTKLKISFKNVMDRSMVEEGSGLRLLEASSQSSKGLYSPYNASGPGSAYGSRSGSRTGSRSGSRRGSIDAGSGFSTNFSSSSFTSSSSYNRRF
ncbi:plectin-like isoform X6 [Gouania willdenowi]|uniref:plectin-like isoform X6 n=1 Tax=Gouania willdenowi TaxID=441366 RepID=UPI00105612C4|nr:plectin-like isoform X6 [Gouania willdenowi]